MTMESTIIAAENATNYSNYYILIKLQSNRIAYSCKSVSSCQIPQNEFIAQQA